MKVYLKQVNGSWFLEIDSYGIYMVEVDGVRFKDFKEGWLDKKPETIKNIVKKSRITDYGNLKPEPYNLMLNELVTKRDDDGYPVFETLEEEYSYKKFISEHAPIYEKYEDFEDFEIIEVNITGITDNPYIQPYRFIGSKVINKDSNAVLYRYTASPYKMAQIIAKSFGLTEIEDSSWNNDKTKGWHWSCPSHSRDNLEFTKINGNYAEYKGMKFYSIEYGTYEECLSRYKEYEKNITDMFQKEVIKLQTKGSPIDKSMVIQELQNIKNSVVRIDYRRNSDITPYQISSRIQKFIDTLSTEKEFTP